MKNKFLLITGGLILILCLFFGTYAWYLYFLSYGNSIAYDETVNGNLKSGTVVLRDDGVGVYDSDADSLEDSEIDDVIPYKFRVINEGDKKDTYTLYIEDLPLNSINDGCTYETLLNREQLKYQLKLNNKVLKEDYLSNINDNILDARTIDPNVINNYELKIYIHDEALEWTGKHYHYKVVLNKTN